MKIRINFDNVLYIGESSYVPAMQKDFVKTFVFHFVGGTTLTLHSTPELEEAVNNYFLTVETAQ